MIKIRFQANPDGSFRRVSISGHAMSGPYGHDLVCAGVSAVSIGALNALDGMFSDDCRLEMDNNQIIIEVLQDSQALQQCLRMLYGQLETIALQHPQAVHLEVQHLS